MPRYPKPFVSPPPLLLSGADPGPTGPSKKLPRTAPLPRPTPNPSTGADPTPRPLATSPTRIVAATPAKSPRALPRSHRRAASLLWCRDDAPVPTIPKPHLRVCEYSSIGLLSPVRWLSRPTYLARGPPLRCHGVAVARWRSHGASRRLNFRPHDPPTHTRGSIVLRASAFSHPVRRLLAKRILRAGNHFKFGSVSWTPTAGAYTRSL